MDWTSLILLAFALCFDSVAVSTVVGMCAAKEKRSYRLRLMRFCLILAIMQGAMPFIGWAMAWNFRHIIEKWDHWIAFGLLFIIGGKMILDSLIKKEQEEESYPLLLEYTKLSRSFLMGLATSIDALIVGVSMALVDLCFIPSGQLPNMITASICIGAVTFLCSAAGTEIGRLGGKGLGNWSNIVGGIILILIGIRILCEHLCLL